MLGSDLQCGSYILRIKLKTEVNLRFGRFKKGKWITLPDGEYAYVGSAMSSNGATSLPLRIMRHATRSGDRLPHQIRVNLVECFKRNNTGAENSIPKRRKKLHWNIDYLLDFQTAEIANVFVIRSKQRLETSVGQLLENDPHAYVIEKGLGANDMPGNTHILRIDAAETWWSQLPDRLRALL